MGRKKRGKGVVSGGHHSSSHQSHKARTSTLKLSLSLSLFLPTTNLKVSNTVEQEASADPFGGPVVVEVRVGCIEAIIGVAVCHLLKTCLCL